MPRHSPWPRRVLVHVLAGLLAITAWAACSADPGERSHPGHYVALAPYDDDPKAMLDSLRPGVEGLLKRYNWRDLEPRPDVYELSRIANDLALVSEEGRQLVVLVCEKSFKDERLTPSYLWEDYTLPVKSRATATGSVSKRWDPYVVERFDKLLQAIAQAFDQHPNLEGVAIQESALGVEDAVAKAHGYTPERYRDALIEQLGNAAEAFPRSRVFWFANFLPGKQSYLQEVVRAVPPKVVIGGPDVLPDDLALQRYFYPTLQSLHGQAETFISMQFESFRHKRKGKGKGGGGVGGKYWTPLELFTFARDELRVNYLFWERVVWPRPRDSFTIEDAYPVIATHPLEPRPVAR